VDLIICGSVAVNRNGVRLGKGAGYSDIEVALLAEAGLIGSHTTIVTTVHPLQVTDSHIPETNHDFSVDFIVTPKEIIACEPPRRPAGLIWGDLTPEQLSAIPVLRDMKGKR
jgi:5-formyltetrahydrofolate cyclo-ligase